MTEWLGDGPVQPEYIDQMKAIARAIDQVFNADDEKTVGFILMVFPFENHGGRCNYMSNADRRDVVTMLKEQLRYFEGQANVTGNA